jgi:outer membrane PBP1 activator LpoA protein
MTVITGLLIQSEFNSTVAITSLEVIIDSAIDSVNTDAGTSIGYMTGIAGAKTITVTGMQAAAIKPMIAMKLTSRATSGAASSSFGLHGISTSSSSSSSAGGTDSDQYTRAIQKLKMALNGIVFEAVADDQDLEE